MKILTIEDDGDVQDMVSVLLIVTGWALRFWRPSMAPRVSNFYRRRSRTLSSSTLVCQI